MKMRFMGHLQTAWERCTVLLGGLIMKRRMLYLPK